MSKLNRIWSQYVLSCFFVISIFGIGISNIPNLCQTVYSQFKSRDFNTAVIEETYNNNFWNKLSFVDYQGLFCKITGQKINNGVIKGSDGKLNLLDNLDYEFVEDDEKLKADKAVKILMRAQQKGADVLYVQRPWATGKVPYDYHFELNEQYDYWCKTMEESGFPVLDLRKEVTNGRIQFYITDHHWTVESSFNANADIIKALNELYGLKLDQEKKYTDIGQYEKINYKNSFLGSEGIRVGKYFAGKDDFEIIVPKYDTDFKYVQYRDHKKYWEAKGDYSAVFIDKEKLEDPKYNNKYNAITYEGYVENRITNTLPDNNLKVLLIADSFARPMVTYLASNFKETRYLDPQDGRYTDSYVDYIDQYEPDVVIMMFPGSGDFKEI